MRLNKIATTVAATVAAAALTMPVASAQSSIPGSSSSGALQELSSNPEIAQEISAAITGIDPGTPGDMSTSRKSTNVPGQGSRDYILQLPSNHNSGVSLPVVFAFGGAEHSAERTKNYMRFSEVTGNDAIVVYPEGRGGFWEGPTYARTSHGQDVEFARSILSDLREKYSVDSSRIYAAGLSNGGGMALALACQAPDIFSAVASVAGAYYTPIINGCSGGDVNTLIVHGSSDNHMNYNGGIGAGGQYYSADHTWRDAARRNGCDLSSVSSKNSGRSEVKSFNGCDHGGETILQRVDGGGHTWYENNPPATQTVWNFLRSH